MTQGHFAVRQEKDAVATRSVTTIAVLGVAIGGAAVVVAALILRAGPAPGGGPAQLTRSGSGVAPRDIGMLTQTLIEHERHAAELRDEEHARLASYGWVDRSKGVVHIPIDRAIDLVVADNAPDAGADGGSAR